MKKRKTEALCKVRKETYSWEVVREIVRGKVEIQNVRRGIDRCKEEMENMEGKGRLQMER